MTTPPLWFRLRSSAEYTTRGGRATARCHVTPAGRRHALALARHNPASPPPSRRHRCERQQREGRRRGRQQHGVRQTTRPNHTTDDVKTSARDGGRGFDSGGGCCTGAPAVGRALAAGHGWYSQPPP
ncbi:hypothetical protein GALMADRAFT_148256 [Galerina marginata CBS 339.88]|uniref:Uncharacterized protein n=1 Tax=Galerina marginata (strain CBS 339.88) TaxID=685588 RepID=A0A067S5B7_GALM3|nr:hypothetical protein GALMADRAFT_148256 [Galerina marginata CBS 339.88]